MTAASTLSDVLLVRRASMSEFSIENSADEISTARIYSAVAIRSDMLPLSYTTDVSILAIFGSSIPTSATTSVSSMTNT